MDLMHVCTVIVVQTSEHRETEDKDDDRSWQNDNVRQDGGLSMEE